MPGEANTFGNLSCSVATENLIIRERHVTLCEPRDQPNAAWLFIDDVEIELQYHKGFDGWRVTNMGLYGAHFPRLQLAANAVIVSNPSLGVWPPPR